MTKKSAPLCLALALGAATASIPAAAHDMLPSASNLHRYEQRVSFADLDLRETAAQKALTQRVRLAARRVCFRNELSTRLTTMQESCFAATYRRAKPHVAAAIRLANTGQVQTAMSLVVSRAAAAL